MRYNVNAPYGAMDKLPQSKKDKKKDSKGKSGKGDSKSGKNDKAGKNSKVSPRNEALSPVEESKQESDPASAAKAAGDKFSF